MISIMTKRAVTQLNIRSAVARARVAELTRRTGKTVTQVVEDALLAHNPSGGDGPFGRLVRKGGILVMPANGRPKLTIEEVEAAFEAGREERLDQIG